MTDNEKAATFLGWEPGPCRGIIDKNDPNKCNGDSNDPCYWIPDGGFNISGIMYSIKHVPHKAIAPDMSKAENYMKVLEGPNISQPELFWDLGGWYCRVLVGPPPKHLSGAGNSASEAAVKALVALYEYNNENNQSAKTQSRTRLKKSNRS